MTPFITVFLTVLSLIQLGWAQIGYNANTNSLLCSKPGGHYCVHGSLQGPTMISCVSITTAEIRSCNIELANILPPGYEDMAICYETAPILGDALCAFNGTGYHRSGKPVPIPETALCTSDPFIGDSDSYGDLDDENAIDSNIDSDIDSDSYYSPSPSYPDDKPNIPRKRLEFTILDSEPEPEREPENHHPTATTATHPDNEKGIIQTIPSLPLPFPVTPVDTLPVSSTLTSQFEPTVNSPSHPEPPCVPQLRVRDPNTTVEGVSLSDPVFAVLTSIPTPTPTSTLGRHRPRLADKCTWTPTPMYRTGAGVLPSSSSPLSIPASSSSTSFSSEVASSSSSVAPAKTLGGKESGAAACLVQRIGVGMLVGWVVGLGALLGWV